MGYYLMVSRNYIHRLIYLIINGLLMSLLCSLEIKLLAKLNKIVEVSELSSEEMRKKRP